MIYSVIVQQWLTLVLDLMVTGLALLVVGLAVKLRDSVSVGSTAVSLIQLISFAETLKILISFWTTLETSIGAVSRIKDFQEQNPKEEDVEDGGQPQAMTAGWPLRGDMLIEGITVSYGRGSADVLRSIDFSVRAGEKIGVCGRTGSGKSTLLLTFLRLLDPSTGSISIDGVPISKLKREDVRRHIITITQDNFFLPGTVRQNLDPYETGASDETISRALGAVGLQETIQEKGGLDAEFIDDMLSHGQKQLFSVARVLLRKTSGRVVLFDEPSSR